MKMTSEINDLNKKMLPSKFKSKKRIVLSFFLLIILLAELFIIFSSFSYKLLQTFYVRDWKIVIEGGKEKDRIKIKKIANNYLKKRGLYFLNLDELSLKLLKIPSISEIKIKKIFPNEIRIYVKNKEPFAYLISGRMYLIDDEGKIIEESTKGEEKKFLPFLYIEEGLNNSVLQRGLKILKEIINYKEEYLKLKLVRYNFSEDIFFIELKDATLLVNGENIEEELFKYIKHKKDIEQINGDSNGILDLRFNNQIILKQNL